jgi:hypothetical protein
MRVVQEVAREIGKLADDLFDDIRMSLRRNENAQPGRAEQGRHELP